MSPEGTLTGPVSMGGGGGYVSFLADQAKIPSMVLELSTLLEE